MICGTLQSTAFDSSRPTFIALTTTLIRSPHDINQPHPSDTRPITSRLLYNVTWLVPPTATPETT
jgi:hypothetical protein